jgi:hypothetical protein
MLNNLMALNIAASEYIGFTILMNLMAMEIITGWFLPFNWWEVYEKEFNRANTGNQG